MLRQVQGSIFNAPKGSVIIQQVNCQNRMGAGIAKAIYERYPIVKSAYHEHCNNKNPESLLGTIQVVPTEDYIFVNLFGQLTYGREGLHTNYEAFARALVDIRVHFRNHNVQFALPYNIGCGLAGGDWTIVRNIIRDHLDMNNDIVLYSDKPIDYRCGITERGDAGFHFEWTKNYMPNINIIISKRLTDSLIDGLCIHRDKVIFHHTVTGFGGSDIEKFVPTKEWSYEQCIKLINSGFPASQIVLRLDPIIPTRRGIQTALSVLDLYSNLGIRRVRFSFMDMYNHVKVRFAESDIPLPYDSFNAPIEMQREFLNAISSYPYHFESCAEESPYKRGCISELDYNLLGLMAPQTGLLNNRSNCTCLGTKTELLNRAQPCPHKCTYCYWKD